MRRLLPLALLICLLLAALPASASAGGGPGIRLVLRDAHHLGKTRVALEDKRWRIRGLVRPYSPGLVATVRFTRGGKSIRTVRRAVRRIPGSLTGQFWAEITPRTAGRVRVRASTARTAQVARAVSRSLPVEVIHPQASAGARGLRVEFLQQRLRKLGYWARVNGRFDGRTQLAVLAFRKTNGLGWRMRANERVFEMLARNRGRFRARFPRAGKHVEADLGRQVLTFFYANGRIWRTIHTSSGTRYTPTVRGRFRVYRKGFGRNSLGMLHSVYFHRGYAIHGYPSVPLYPASHGCLRIPERYARWVNRWLKRGDRVFVYR